MIIRKVKMEHFRGFKDEKTIDFQSKPVVLLSAANGIGKTTLLKSILGLIPALEGSVRLGDNLQIGYFEQEGSYDNATTCIEEIWKEFPSLNQAEVRAALAKCGLTTKHIESQVRVLSGGEQAKVRLCKLINRESNILLLDEPTNHLDVDAKEELKRIVDSYEIYTDEMKEKLKGIIESGKTIVCGHWHCSFGHARYEHDGSEFESNANFTPYRANGIIALDACTALSGKVNCIVIED